MGEGGEVRVSPDAVGARLSPPLAGSANVLPLCEVEMVVGVAVGIDVCEIAVSPELNATELATRVPGLLKLLKVTPGFLSALLYWSFWTG